MKDVKVLGPGCKRCVATADIVQQAADRFGVAVSIEKVTDYAAIAGYGVASTPASSSTAALFTPAACRSWTMSPNGWPPDPRITVAHG